MADLPYDCRFGTPQDGPRGKLPVLIEGDRKIPDSRIIRRHLESTYRVDFDEGLTPAQRGRSVALQRLCEEHLYWASVGDRPTALDATAYGILANLAVPALPSPLVEAAEARFSDYLRRVETRVFDGAPVPVIGAAQPVAA